MSARLLPLDGIRALAVVGTVGFHLPGAPLEGGVAGVDMFFVLSGFLIAGVLLAQAEHGRVRLWDFWAARARRLFPALWVMLATVAAILLAFPTLAVSPRWSQEGAWAASYLQNFYFISIGADYFAFAANSPFGHLWSLSVEEQFYLIFPFLVLLALGFSRGLKPGRAYFVGSITWTRWCLLVLTCFAASASFVFSLSAVEGRGHYGPTTTLAPACTRFW